MCGGGVGGRLSVCTNGDAVKRMDQCIYIHIQMEMPSREWINVYTYTYIHINTYMRGPQRDERRDEACAVVGAAVVGGHAAVEAGDPAAGGVRHLLCLVCWG